MAGAVTDSSIVASCYSTGAIGGRFTAKDGRTTQNGKLPGLRGRAAEMPRHLR